MALQICMSSSPSPASPSPLRYSWGFGSTAAGFVLPGQLRRRAAPTGLSTTYGTGRAARNLPVRSSLEIAGTKAGTVTEVDKDTFWPLVKAAGDKVVVLDMYTQWCGPCKVIAPKYQELSEKYTDVVFLKLDCNQENRPLAKELGIRVVPTFKILKDGEVVKEVTGAKFDDLVLAIETVTSS